MNKLLRVTISVLLLGWLAWRTDWARVQATFAGLRIELWLAALGVLLGLQVVSGLRWCMLARPLGFKGSARRFTGIYFIGMFFNLILPTSVGGDVIRAWYLNGDTGRIDRAVLSVFMDRLSGLVVLLCLACVAQMFAPPGLPMWIGASVWTTMALGVVGACALPGLTRYLPAKYQRLSADVLQSFTGVLRPAPVFMSLLVQGGNILLVWLLGKAVAAPVPGFYYGILVPMVSLLTLLPLSINGMGVREGGMVLFLAPFVPADTAVILGFLWFTVTATGSLLGGLVYVFGRFPRLEVQGHDRSLGDRPHEGRTRQYSTAA